jgi:predicted dehydrogenase
VSKIRVGIIGGGGIAHAHLPRLTERTDDVEVTGVADVNPAARATAEQYGVDRFVSDYHELLPHVDAVVICVPTFLHAEIAIDCLEAGKDVFCEKPLSRTLEEAGRMRAAVQKSGKIFQIGFVRRFDDEWLAWRDAVQAGKIGRPVFWHDVKLSPGPVWAPWFCNEEKGGGPFLDGCIHNFDFALYTFGPAQWAFANLRTLRPSNTALDTGTATVRFASGDDLTLTWSWGLPKDVTGSNAFELLGPEGVITWPRNETPDATERHFQINKGEDVESVAFPAGALGAAQRKQVDEFIAVLQGKQQPQAGFEAGYEANRLALAVLQSGRSGQVVQL